MSALVFQSVAAVDQISVLNLYCQKHKKSLPSYTFSNSRGNSSTLWHSAELVFDGVSFKSQPQLSRIKAKQDSAAMCTQSLGIGKAPKLLLQTYCEMQWGCVPIYTAKTFQNGFVTSVACGDSVFTGTLSTTKAASIEDAARVAMLSLQPPTSLNPPSLLPQELLPQDSIRVNRHIQEPPRGSRLLAVQPDYIDLLKRLVVQEALTPFIYNYRPNRDGDRVAYRAQCIVKSRFWLSTDSELFDTQVGAQMDASRLAFLELNAITPLKDNGVSGDIGADAVNFDEVIESPVQINALHEVIISSRGQSQDMDEVIEISRGQSQEMDEVIETSVHDQIQEMEKVHQVEIGAGELMVRDLTRPDDLHNETPLMQPSLQSPGKTSKLPSDITPLSARSKRQTMPLTANSAIKKQKHGSQDAYFSDAETSDCLPTYNTLVLQVCPLRKITPYFEYTYLDIDKGMQRVATELNAGFTFRF